MIDLTIHDEKLKKNVKRCKEKNIVIPTFEQMKNPEITPEPIKTKLKTLALWDIHPANLFRINWKNEAVDKGGLFGGVNYIELPKAITGVDARIFAIVGKLFPTGAHKVGAAFGCLAPRLVTGQFDPTSQKAVWPSTGNYCRGGAYDSALLGCESIAILPEGMSKERFEWLKTIAGEVIATPGSESNVKEIYDKCHELRETRKSDICIFNQFDEMGNHLWHYTVTGSAMEEVINSVLKDGKSRFAGMTVTTGSAGTIAAGDYLKKKFPSSKVIGCEALQCPTLIYNGFGAHRIEGIGDKHIPWVHNVKNTDMIMAIDDEDCMRILRLFNEAEGKDYLKSQGVTDEMISNLSYIGISGIANIISAIKFAKYYELTSKDLIMTVLTDSVEMYGSRIEELKAEHGAYTSINAAVDYASCLQSVKTDHILELNYNDKKRIHNLKYYTWVEQQGKTVEELNSQWYDDEYWTNIHAMAPEIDKLINQFNDMTGVLASMQ